MDRGIHSRAGGKLHCPALQLLEGENEKLQTLREPFPLRDPLSPKPYIPPYKNSRYAWYDLNGRLCVLHPSLPLPSQSPVSPATFE